ncbi:MAG: DcaP family trimeric outer membrane transporter [Hyphomonadaceae bacterium]|nr:DcaP family trimeric outer membrane transporter [Hyphomonadaceae bacterium]
MSHRIKTALLSCAVSALLWPAAAQAQDSELEARLAALEAMVAELKAELAAETAATDADIVRLEEVATAAVEAAPSASGDGFTVGDTTFKIGGFVDVDAHVTELSDGGFGGGSIARDFYIPGATPIGGDSTTTTDLTAEASRFFVTANTDMGGHKVGGRIEMDFLGSAQGNERVSSSFSPRLRRAFVTVDNVLVGQEWSTFQNTSAIPESASFLVLSDGMVFIRQAQVRYTMGNWQIALENGNATVTPVGGGRIEADTNIIPDVVARYNWKGDFGNVSFAAIGRQLRLEMPGIEEETFGFGLSAQGRVNVGEKDDIRFTVVGGEGLGRYVGLNAFNGAAIDPMTGELEAIPSYGGLIAWRHPFGETARFNVGYSGLFADNPDFLGAGATESVQSAFGAILWEPAPRVTMGGEIMFGQRETEGGADGSIARFTFSTKYAF